MASHPRSANYTLPKSFVNRFFHKREINFRPLRFPDFRLKSTLLVRQVVDRFRCPLNPLSTSLQRSADYTQTKPNAKHYFAIFLIIFLLLPISPDFPLLQVNQPPGLSMNHPQLAPLLRICAFQPAQRPVLRPEYAVFCRLHVHHRFLQRPDPPFACLLRCC